MADLGRMTQLWFTKAKDDLKVARALLDFESEHFEAAVFHCQQAAEKSIKGYLTHHKVRFNKTHDIEKLLTVVATVNESLSARFKRAAVLTKYAVAYRYPEEVDLPEPLNKKISEEAFELSKEIFDSLKI